MAANELFSYNRSRQKYLQTLILWHFQSDSQISSAGLGYGWEFSRAEQFRLARFRLCFADCTFPLDSPFSREYNRPVVTWKKLFLSINHMYSSSSNKMPWTVIISFFANIFFSWFMALALSVWSPRIWKRSHVLLPWTHKCQFLCFWGCEWLLMLSYAGFLNKTHTV